MSAAEQIAEAKAEARRAERAALDAKIRLAIVQDKITAHETAEARRQKVLIQSAVKKMVATGAVHAGDHYGQFRMLEQLARDPSLVTLALTKKIFRAEPAAVPEK
jgi:rhamnose utilization protein RhaD (predicted bifunctional aldolase and dehydrogenase)